MKENLLTTEAAASYLGIKKSYLHKLMMRRSIPYYKPNGKYCYFAREDLDHWLTRHRVSSLEELEQQAQAYITNKTSRRG